MHLCMPLHRALPERSARFAFAGFKYVFCRRVSATEMCIPTHCGSCCLLLEKTKKKQNKKNPTNIHLTFCNIFFLKTPLFPATLCFRISATALAVRFLVARFAHREPSPQCRYFFRRQGSAGYTASCPLALAPLNHSPRALHKTRHIVQNKKTAIIERSYLSTNSPFPTHELKLPQT